MQCSVMPTIFTDPKPTAEFDGTEYRYTWQIKWDAEKPLAAWLMMNPSWANLDRSDMTIDRVLHFCREHDCGGVTVINLWPKITPDSGAMWRAIPSLPVEKVSANLAAITRVGKAAHLRVVAFGVDAGRDHRAHVLSMVGAFGDSHLCLGTSSDGWPYHPMARGKYRIPDDRRLSAWKFPNGQPTKPNEDVLDGRK
jgi:hypothetical protein